MAEPISYDIESRTLRPIESIVRVDEFSESLEHVIGSSESSADEQMNEIQKLFTPPEQMKDETDDAYLKRTKDYREYVEHDALLFRKLGVFSRAAYFDTKGNRLVPPVEGYDIKERFSTKYDRHMPHFLVYVSGKPIRKPKDANTQDVDQDAEQEIDTNDTTTEDVASQAAALDDAASEYAASDDAVPDDADTDDAATNDAATNDAATDDAATDDAKEDEADKPNLEAFQDTFDSKEESISRSCLIQIHYEALQYIACIDMTQARHNADEEQLISETPEPILEYIQARRNENIRPVLVCIQFDIDAAGKYRTHVGTPFFAEAFTTEAKTGLLTIVLDGSSNTVLRIMAIRDLLETHRAYGTPLDNFFLKTTSKKSQRRVFRLKSMNHKGISAEGFKYQPRLFFTSLDDYYIVQSVFILADRDSEKQRSLHWEDAEFKLVLGKVSNAGERVYSGWFRLPPNIDRPTAGTVLKITFESQWNIIPTETLKPEVWNGRVSQASPGPHDMVPITLSRKWISATRQFSKQKVRAIATQDLQEHSLISTISQDPGNKVHITFKPEDKVAKAQLRSIEDVNHIAKDRPELTQFNKDMQIALVGSSIHTLKPRDVFEEVRAELGDPTTFMNLNECQKRAVEAMQSAPGGLKFVQGPSGTGKSHLIVEVTKVMMMSKKLRQVLIVTSANTAVDTLANKVEDVLNSLRKSGQLKKDGWVVRAYAPSAEKSIRKIKADLKRDKSNKRPANIQGDIQWDTIDLATSLITHHYLGENKAPHKGEFAELCDTRVQSPELSAMIKALEVIGYIKGKHTSCNLSRWAVHLAAAYAHGERKDDEGVGDLIKDAVDYVITNAKAVVTTTDYAGRSGMTTALSKTELLICDEAPREKDTSLLPIFALRAPIKGALILSDWLQLKPTFISSTEDNIYAKQGELSFMPRMIHIGMPYSKLTEQHQAMYDQQQMSILFTKFATTYASNASKSLLLVDAKSSDVNVTEFRGSSRYNIFYVFIAISMAVEQLELHPKSTVAMVTGYSARRDLMKQAAANVRMLHPNWFKDSERLFVSTIDSAQDGKYDFVIDQILTTPTGLGFQKDARRGNVAITLARHGYVLITNVEEACGTKKADLAYVGRLINYMKKYRIEVPPMKKMPQCKYLKTSERAAQHTRLSEVLQFSS